MNLPKNVTFFVTNACNSRCSHCFNWKEKPTGELTIEEIKKISFEGVKSIALTGGEPTLRNDLTEIISHLSKVKLISLCSNSILKNRVIGALKEINKKSNAILQTSIDGTEEFHDKIRGNGAFWKTIETIDEVTELNNVNIQITTTISKINKDNLEDIILFLQKRYGKKIKHAFNITRGNQHVWNLPKDITYFHSPREDVILSTEENKRIYKKILDLNKKYNFWEKDNQLIFHYTLKIMEEKKKLLKCYAGYHSCILHSNGDVSMCEYTKPFANLRDFNYNFFELWNSKEANESREKIKMCFCCHCVPMMSSIVRKPKHTLELLPKIIKSKIK